MGKRNSNFIKIVKGFLGIIGISVFLTLGDGEQHSNNQPENQMVREQDDNDEINEKIKEKAKNILANLRNRLS